MSRSSSVYRITPYGFLLIGFLLGLALAIPAYLSIFFDDAYIHARIAEHIQLLGVPVFNPGVIFKVGSSTGYVFLVALLGEATGTINAIRHIEAFSIVVTVTGLFYLLTVSRANRAVGFLAVVSVIPYFLYTAYGGMETSVVCMLMTLAAISEQHRQDEMTVTSISIAAWFRFEAVLLLLLLLVYLFRAKRVRASILFFSFPVIALFSIEIWLFGTIIPHAAKVKPIAYGLPLTHSAFNALSFGMGKSGVLFGLLFILAMAAMTTNLWRSKFRLGMSDVFTIFCAAVFASWIIGRSLIFPWYFCLLVFPLGIAVLLCEGRYSLGNIADVILRFVLIPIILVGFFLLGSKSVFSSFSSDNSNQRVLRYLDIGSELYSRCPTCTLVTSEIGGLGYSFRGELYDAFALGDPEALRFHPLKVPEDRQGFYVGAIPPQYVSFRNPDYIVSMPAFSHALRNSNALAGYHAYDCPFDEPPLSIFGDKKIQIFSKKKLHPDSTRLMRCASVSAQQQKL